MATDGMNRILDIVPDNLHQRVPLFVGSKKDVEQVRAIYEKAQQA
jgi:fructose-1,6-bisphosphatase I